MISFASYILDELNLYREYDQSNFAMNSNNALHNKVDLVKTDVDLNLYAESLNSVLNDIDNAPIQSDLLIKFFSTMSTNIIIDKRVPDIVLSDIGVIKPQYLEQYVNSIGLIIDRAIKGENLADIDNIVSGDASDKVKKQMVRTNIPYHYTGKNILNTNTRNSATIQVDLSFVKNKVLPFLKSVDNNLAEIRKDIISSISAIKSCSKNITAYNTTIDNLKVREKFDEATIKRINYIRYNAYRSLLDATSFLSAMVIRKADNIIKNINVCNTVFSLFSLNTRVTEMIESTIMPDDTNSLAENLVQGHADAFVDIANNIFDYNNGIMTNSPESPIPTDNNSENLTSYLLDNASYDKKVYEDIIKMWIIINEGLSNISSGTDDYILVYDDLISQSGFDITINDRFKTTIATIDDVSAYTSAANLPAGEFNTVYFNMLAEVRDFGKNMQAIANGCFETKSIIDHLKERFDNNINKEYANAETTKELVVFLDDLTQDFFDLVKEIAGKFMLRLKNINIALSQLNNKRNEKYNYEEASVDTNFIDDLDNIFIESFENETDMIFEYMMREYVKARELRDRGAIIIFEDGGEKANKKSLLNIITEWFNKLVEKLTGIMRDPQAKRDQAYLKNNRNALLNKDYSNITKEAIDYGKADGINDINISNITSGLKNRTNKEIFLRLKGTDNEQAIKLFFPVAPPTSVLMSNSVANSVTKYYTSGINGEIQPSSFSGDALKDLVQRIVSYCESFYTNVIPNMKNEITSIKNNMSSAIDSIQSTSVASTNTVVKESALFTEKPVSPNESSDSNKTANNTTDNNTQTKTTNNTTTTTNNNQNNNNKNTNDNSIINNCQFIEKVITGYCNGTLTALFDRYKADMTLLRSIVPDNNGNPQNNQNNNQNV